MCRGTVDGGGCRTPAGSNGPGAGRSTTRCRTRAPSASRSTSAGRSSPGWPRAWGDGPRRGRRAAPLRRTAGSRRTNAERIGDQRQGTPRPPRWSILQGDGGWRGIVDVPVLQGSLGFSYDAVYEITAPADITFLTLYKQLFGTYTFGGRMTKAAYTQSNEARVPWDDGYE